MSQASIQFEVEDDEGYPVDFWRWLDKNELVYRAFKVYAFRMAMLGHKRFSAKRIVEELRWNSDLSDSEKTFKLNNNYTSGMARFFMFEHGERYPGFFRLRDRLGRDV